MRTFRQNYKKTVIDLYEKVEVIPGDMEETETVPEQEDREINLEERPVDKRIARILEPDMDG